MPTFSEKPPCKPINTTAYRIFRLLQGLLAGPLGIAEINALFCADSRIGKPVSSDSIWLYINTLRAIGCQIRRPAPRNGFRYELGSHPFGMALSATTMEMLAHAKKQAQEQFSHRELLLLDGLLKKILVHSGHPEADELAEQWFNRSRSVDYTAHPEKLSALEQWTTEKRALRIRYVSPLRGEETFDFLPDRLFYRQGALYLHGERADGPGPRSLRVDRILAVEPCPEVEPHTLSSPREHDFIEVTAHILADSPEAFPGFEPDERQEIHTAHYVWIPTSDAASDPQGPYVEARWRVGDWFYLKQRLLGCGFPFRIITPKAFRTEMRTTLQAMDSLYADEPRLPETNASIPVRNSV